MTASVDGPQQALEPSSSAPMAKSLDAGWSESVGAELLSHWRATAQKAGDRLTSAAAALGPGPKGVTAVRDVRATARRLDDVLMLATLLAGPSGVPGGGPPRFKELAQAVETVRALDHHRKLVLANLPQMSSGPERFALEHLLNLITRDRATELSPATKAVSEKLEQDPSRRLSEILDQSAFPSAGAARRVVKSVLKEITAELFSDSLPQVAEDVGLMCHLNGRVKRARYLLRLLRPALFTHEAVSVALKDARDTLARYQELSEFSTYVEAHQRGLTTQGATLLVGALDSVLSRVQSERQDLALQFRTVGLGVEPRDILALT